MKAKARLFCHPVHQILIVFPLGLLATSFFFDLAYLANGRAELAVVASWMIFAGVLGGAAAALFGIIDWLAIPRGTRARRVGAGHGGGNLIVAALFAVSWMIRRDNPGHPEGIAIALSGCGVLLTVLTGWLGSELADRMEDL
ncbi:MAG TPA: DUF2231 domain-containing protein [Thermoanaerobaculia bacterium]|jgi:uncharacterized membrane protein|nr:DUF2231 domain-containing protein [Thermoanaerobaculia bacterium]